MESKPQELGQLDRRPIAARRFPIFRTIALQLARWGVSPDAISVAGMLVGCIAGVLLAMSALHPEFDRFYLFVAVILIQLRLICNLLDGMVAIEGGKRSPLGDVFNEVPDRISDAAILVGAGYAVTSSPMLGWAAALAACFVAYIRVVGRSLGQPGDYRGPMAKQQRMFLITLACVVLVVIPDSSRWLLIPDDPFPIVGIMSATLWLILLGCTITAARRLGRLASNLRTHM